MMAASKSVLAHSLLTLGLGAWCVWKGNLVLAVGLGLLWLLTAFIWLEWRAAWDNIGVTWRLAEGEPDVH